MIIFITSSLKHVHTLPLLYLYFDHCRWVCHSTFTGNVTCIPEQEGGRERDRDQKANVEKQKRLGNQYCILWWNWIKGLKWICKTIIEPDTSSWQVGTNQDWAVPLPGAQGRAGGIPLKPFIRNAGCLNCPLSRSQRRTSLIKVWLAEWLWAVSLLATST